MKEPLWETLAKEGRAQLIDLLTSLGVEGWWHTKPNADTYAAYAAWNGFTITVTAAYNGCRPLISTPKGDHYGPHIDNAQIKVTISMPNGAFVAEISYEFGEARKPADWSLSCAEVVPATFEPLRDELPRGPTKNRFLDIPSEEAEGRIVELIRLVQSHA